MNIDLSFLPKALAGQSVPRPNITGTLSGHAAGEPLADLVFRTVKARYPEITYRQFEFLNKLYTAHAGITTVGGRWGLIEKPALATLLARGRKATESWSAELPFQEKQNDTADILVVKDNFYNLLDVKTSQLGKKAQPPNIISAYKLAVMCGEMLESTTFDSHDIIYIGIDWKLESDRLVCQDVYVRRLFLANPAKLYINWAAAYQVQFDTRSLDQDYGGTIEEWSVAYLQHYIDSAKKAMKSLQDKHIDPFAALLAKREKMRKFQLKSR